MKPIGFGLAGLILSAILIHAQNSSYLKESRQVFDQARLIPANDFNPSALRRVFVAFVGRECKGRTISRLIVAPTEDDLGRAVNAAFIDLTPKSEAWIASTVPAVFGAEGGSPRVAQVLCLAGNATATIRDGNAVSSYQISGSHDARSLSIDGLDIAIVGFSVSPPGAPLWVFVKTRILPALPATARVRDELQDLIKVEAIIVLRTDPFFWTFNGPKGDVFTVPAPKISSGDFMKKPYIICPARGTRRSCQVQTPER